MKKFIIGLILLAVSLILAPFSYQKINALDSVEITTIFPDNILDYVNLTNISSFSVEENYISYTLDKTTITVFNKSNKSYRSINGFNNIKKIKFFNDKLIVVDNSNIKVVDTNNIQNNASDLTTLSDISLENLQAIDIYTNGDTLLVGIVSNNTFKLYEYNNSLQQIKTNPIKTTYSSFFANTYMMAINNNNAYIAYKTDIAIEPTGLCIQNYSNTEPIIKTFIPNANIIDTFKDKDNEYILTFTNETLYLLSHNGSVIHKVNIGAQDKESTNQFPILKITDFDFFNGKIYISDSVYKTIQTFVVKDNNLESDEIILGSSSFNEGRFNSVNDIFLQGETIFTADTGNNRIHYLKDNKSYFINDIENTANPHSVVVDKANNLYFVKDNNNGSILCKYNYKFNTEKEIYEYQKQTEYNLINNDKIGLISDICATNSNNIYLLEYLSNSNEQRILYLSDTGLESINTLNIKINKDSQIEYLKALDTLIVLNNSYISIINKKGMEINKIYINACAENNCTENNCSIHKCSEITVDFDKIYAHCGNTIKLVSIKDNKLVEESNNLTIDASNLTRFSFDIMNRRMIAFDNNRSCLVYFDCHLSTNPFIDSNIDDTTPLQATDKILALELKYNSLIYDLPFEIGNYYNLDNSVTNCIAIGEYEHYYRVLFNNNNELKVGYILKSVVDEIQYKYNPIKVITTHNVVPIYKYPTLLKYNGERIITQTLDTRTKLTLSYMFPITIDDKTFYTYKYDNNIGFLFSVDIVLDENTNIKNLNTENASIKIIEEIPSIELLDKDNNKIIDLKDNTRIYVEKYDKDSEYTKVIYKDDNLQTYEGYIETKYIQMDELDNSQLILISLIIISVLLLLTIAIVYIVIKKKQR